MTRVNFQILSWIPASQLVSERGSCNVLAMSSPNPLEALGDFLSGPFRRMGASSAAAASRAPAASSSAPQAEATADERDTGGGVLPKSKAGKPAKLSAGARALALTEAEAQERKARREAELAGLKQALQILDGEAVLIQQKAKHALCGRQIGPSRVKQVPKQFFQKTLQILVLIMEGY